MRGTEIEALGSLGGGALASFGGVARGVHRSVAGRTFGALGVLGTPVRVMHDGISTLAYGAVAGGLRALPRAGGHLLARAVPPGAPALADSPPGGAALGALNGAFGDRVAREQPALALELTVRRRGRVVATDSA